MSTYSTPLTIILRECTSQQLHHAPNSGTTESGATVPRKRTAEPGAITPSSTRLCLGTHKQGSHGLQNKKFYSSEYTQQISVYDEINRDKIEHVPDYVTDIYQRLYYAEVSKALWTWLGSYSSTFYC
jgi:hypothetical protein